MLYKLLKILFHDDDFYRYTPKPWHLVYPVLMIGVGSVTMRANWIAFGLTMFISGIALMITIIVGINWDKSIEYWETVERFASTMMKSRNPDLWMALGFKSPPSKIMIEERHEANNDHGLEVIYQKLPVSPAVMQSIADKVLLSGNTDFVEEMYSNFVPRIRKVKDALKKNGYITPKNNKNVRLGYTFTRKGVNALYEYASDGIKLELERRR